MYFSSVDFYLCYPFVSSLFPPYTKSAASIVYPYRCVAAIFSVGNFPQVAYSVIGSNVIDMAYLFLWGKWVIWIAYIPC